MEQEHVYLSLLMADSINPRVELKAITKPEKCTYALVWFRKTLGLAGQ
jgi:hypothetical protein